MMNPRVTLVGEQIVGLYEQQREALARLGAPELLELEHEMEHLRNHQKFTVRAGSEIIRAAALMLREEKLSGGQR